MKQLSTIKLVFLCMVSSLIYANDEFISDTIEHKTSEYLHENGVVEEKIISIEESDLPEVTVRAPRPGAEGGVFIASVFLPGNPVSNQFNNNQNDGSGTVQGPLTFNYECSCMICKYDGNIVKKFISSC